MPSGERSLVRTLHSALGDALPSFTATQATLVDLSLTFEEEILRNQLPSAIFTGNDTGLTGQHITASLESDDARQHEWFLLVLTHDFAALVAGLDRQELAERELDRMYDMVLSFDPAVISRAIDAILPLVDVAQPDRAAALRRAVAEFPPVAPTGARASAIVVQTMQHVQARYAAQQATLTELLTLRREQERLVAVFADLAVPVVPVLEGVIALPLIGSFDNRRAQLLMERLLQGIADQQAEVAIIDITGVSVIDTAVANALGQAVRAAQLLGAQIIVSGIRAEVAQTLVGLGVTLGNVITVASLRAAVDAALEQQGRIIVPRTSL